MTKKYKILGLDCPNCAKALERKLNDLDCIQSVNINFVKSYIQIQSNNPSLALEQAIKLTKKLEPNATILDPDKGLQVKKTIVWDIMILLLGIALAAIVFTVNLPTVLYWILFVCSALLLGYKTYLKAINLLVRGVINENLLVTISVIGATAVGEHFDGLMVIALYSIGKILESLALEKSKKSIEALAAIKPEYAVRISGGEQTQVDPSDLEIGDIIIVKAGEKIAVDGIVTQGSVSLNTQSLTGESLPQTVGVGDTVLSGSIVLDGVIFVQATKLFTESTVSKIVNLIQNAKDKKAKTETVIAKISRWYTLGVLLLAVMVFGIVWATSKNLDNAIYRGLIFLVVSCPCAFAISVPLAYFSGIGNASKNGILVKGSNYLDILAKLDLIAFDKTGTLTTGEFEIVQISSTLPQNELLYLAALGEKNSNHPLAKTIVAACDRQLDEVSDLKELAGQGIQYTFNGNNYFVGRKDKNQKDTVVQVYENDVLLGQIYFKDAIKSNAKQTILQLQKMGIKTAMLSGDNWHIVNQVADELGINQSLSRLLPEDKFAWLQNAKQEHSLIGYVGDGINDAPSLTLADVGISMGLNGSSASIEASDIVIANDNPQKIVQGIAISKYTRKIVWQNIIVSGVIKVTFLTLGALGITGMLSAVIADVGVTLLAILNSLRALKFSPDKHLSSNTPCLHNTKPYNNSTRTHCTHNTSNHTHDTYCTSCPSNAFNNDSCDHSNDCNNSNVYNNSNANYCNDATCDNTSNNDSCNGDAFNKNSCNDDIYNKNFCNSNICDNNSCNDNFSKDNSCNDNIHPNHCNDSRRSDTCNDLYKNDSNNN